MDFLAEYDEFKKLPVHIAVTYKFLSNFTVDSSGSLFYTQYRFDINEDFSKEYTKEAAEALKKFLKATRKELKEGSMNKFECSRRIWFFYQKLMDLHVFSTEVRREILSWMETCETVLI
jgi:hypothetical protein